MRGLHLIADLAGCAVDAPAMVDAAILRERCLRSVAQAGLTPVGDVFHRFAGQGGAGGVTCAVLLAESHLAVHTWPELAAVTIDVYVCNFGADNSARARELLRDLVAEFAPGRVSLREVERGADG